MRTQTPPRSSAVAVLLTCSLLPFAGACGSSDDAAEPPAEEEPEESPAADSGVESPIDNPMLDAYAALEAADYDALPDLIARLDAAIEENPDVGRLSFYAGTMRLWRAIGAPRTVNEVLEDVQGAIDAFERAHDLSPQDPHAAAFLGITQVAFGNALRDEQRIETGRAVLADNTHLYPPYVNGVRTQAMGMLPRDHAYFPEAIDAMYATLAACGAETAPDADFSIVYPSAASDPLPTCWNQGVVDHVWEGIFLIYGDVFVKNGEPARARQLYEAARLSPTFETWLFGDELDERIASSDDRAALYLDADPANDPLTWMQGQNLCVGCHASRP